MGIYIPGAQEGANNREITSDTSGASLPGHRPKVQELVTFEAADPNGIALEHLTSNGSTISLPSVLRERTDIEGFRIHTDATTFDAEKLRDGPFGAEYSATINVTIYWKGNESTGFDDFPVTITSQSGDVVTLTRDEDPKRTAPEDQYFTAA